MRRLCPNCRTAYVPQGSELANIKRDFQLDGALKRFNALKDTKEAAPAPAEAAAPAPAPVSQMIEPSDRKKGRTITPEHSIETSKSILDKIAADPNIINRSLGDVGKPKATAAAAPAPGAPAAPAPAATPAPAPADPAKLKSGEFLLYKAGAGCDACGGQGYQGRMGIYEVLEVDETLSKMIVGHATSDDLQMAAVRSGMLTMQQDGFVKALQGKTTIEEILRVTRE